MKIISRFLSVALLFAALNVNAQQVDVSPTPQTIKWGEKAFDRPSVFNIVGAPSADADAVKALTDVFPKGKGIKLKIGERGSKSVASVTSKIPDKAQGYYLKVSPDEVIIAGNDATGTFYGVQTFLAVASQPEVMSVEVIDWPATYNRGVVEGFYGNAWSFDDRVSQFEFYGRNKMDTYIYGPKDDPYHRGMWREFYPEEDAARLKALNEVAKRNKVKFVWGMHPAGDHSWQEDDNIATVRKFEKMYDLGIRNFAIFFDDVFGVHADGRKHAEYMDYVMDNFVKKHPDIENIIICPSLYNKEWESRFQPTYLEDISKMDPSINIMWTGNSVVDMIDRADMEWVNPLIGRKAFIWLNYPVNDYCVDHLLMGPFTGNQPGALSLVNGFTANPMEFAEASKVSLYGTADFLWNPDAYDADKAWERALTTLAPRQTDAFRRFCLYNIDLGPNSHRLRRLNETPRFRQLVEQYGETLDGTNSKSAAAAFAGEFADIRNVSSDLINAAVDNRLFIEIKPWLEAAELLGKRGLAVVDMHNALSSGDNRAFIDSYEDYRLLTDRAQSLTARDFKGSIKVAHPVVGTAYVEPFLRRSVADMITAYKSRSDYRLDLFPNQLLDNALYHIKVGGKYLGNPDAGIAGAAPVLQSDEDVVNPDRQIWRLVFEPETECYSIVNAKDGQYLNDYCQFGKEAYDVNYHTFDIQPADGGGYLIINRSNGYPTYWKADGNQLVRIYSADQQSVFELIPIK